MLRLGALPGGGNLHSMPALVQFEHGCLLSHPTFRFLQVVHDLGFVEGVQVVEVAVGDAVSVSGVSILESATLKSES